MRFEISDTIKMAKNVISSLEKLYKFDWTDMTSDRELRNVMDIIHAYSFFLPTSYFNWIDWIT